jgi:hypothetical protein
MDYVVLIYRDESKDGEVDWDQLGKDYDAYATAAVHAGVMRGGQKLQPSATATTVAIREGERLVTDGPFAEARDLDEALEWAARCPGASHGTVEVRPVMPT